MTDTFQAAVIAASARNAAIDCAFKAADAAIAELQKGGEMPYVEDGERFRSELRFEVAHTLLAVLRRGVANWPKKHVNQS